MIKSTYVTALAVPPFDSLVSTLLDYPMEGGGKDMRIAIEAPGGSVYRVVTTTGMGAFIHAINGLLRIGFTDLLAHETRSVDGFDARMALSDDVGSHAVVEHDPIEALGDREPNAVADDLADLFSGSPTVRSALVSARLGQGVFRAKVIKHWGTCAVTGSHCLPLLRASHIKPWRDSSDEERLDPNNGLLLAPNLDAAFDGGFITFEDSGRIVLSARATGVIAYQLHITAKMRLTAKLLNTEHRKYLQFHRSAVFLG